MIDRIAVFFLAGLCVLAATSTARADGQVLCTTANNGDWASDVDLNNLIANLAKTQPALQVSAPTIASSASSTIGSFPNFEMCVSANYGPPVASKNYRVVCTAAKDGSWAQPDGINSAIAQLQHAGSNVQVSVPAITINTPSSANGFPNLELCVTLAF